MRERTGNIEQKKNINTSTPTNTPLSFLFFSISCDLSFSLQLSHVDVILHPHTPHLQITFAKEREAIELAMVFPSPPIYLDPPNWSHQQPNHQQVGIGNQNPLAPQPPASTVAVGSGGGGAGGFQGSSIRPGSMADKARLAKIHQADATLKCPRCESTNTKFCYYNNYSLSQPRHFCKTCRRYWTRGGALRNVPVGGGCRRNKRSKGNTGSSKPPLKPAAGGSSSASANSSSTNGCTTTTTNNSDVNVVMGHHLPTQFPFLPSLHHYNNSDYASGGIGSHFGAKNIGNSSSTNAEFQIGNGSSNGGSLLLSNGIGEQWRFSNLQQLHQQHQQQQQQQQFPFLTNLEPQIGLFQFGGHGENNAEPPSRFIRSKPVDSHSLNAIKMEENNQQGLSLPKNLLSGSGNNELFWNGSGNNNAWSEVPSFMTPSPNHFL